MNLKALIVEQLEANGSIRTLQMLEGRKPFVVAFANEYEEVRSGPFHFLDDERASAFDEGFAAARTRRLGDDRFQRVGEKYIFNTSWLGIPTKRDWLTYYALSLPQFAVPSQIRLNDPHSGRDYRKSVCRDDQRNRFNVYLECRSKIGTFDFVLEVRFAVDSSAFPASAYTDPNTDPYGRQIDEYRHTLGDRETMKVKQYFNFVGGDQYQVDSANAVGRDARVRNIRPDSVN